MRLVPRVVDEEARYVPSVAAEIVTFLETLRDGLVPVVTAGPSAW
ncbi:hypothetical protein ACFY4Q_18445 [[Kitasatospora] papulosa]